MSSELCLERSKGGPVHDTYITVYYCSMSKGHRGPHRAHHAHDLATPPVWRGPWEDGTTGYESGDRLSDEIESVRQGMAEVVHDAIFEAEASTSLDVVRAMLVPDGLLSRISDNDVVVREVAWRLHCSSDNIRDALEMIREILTRD